MLLLFKRIAFLSIHLQNMDYKTYYPPLSLFNFDFYVKNDKINTYNNTTFFQRRRFLTIDALFMKRAAIIRFPTPPQARTIAHALQIKGNWIIVTLYDKWLWLLMQFDLRSDVNVTKHVSF